MEPTGAGSSGHTRFDIREWLANLQLSREDGQGLVEYALIIGLVSVTVVSIAGLNLVAGATQALLSVGSAFGG